MWGPIPNSSAPTVISIVISLGKQGTVRKFYSDFNTVCLLCLSCCLLLV